jgi:hypothetical protein
MLEVREGLPHFSPEFCKETNRVLDLHLAGPAELSRMHVITKWLGERLIHDIGGDCEDCSLSRTQIWPFPLLSDGHLPGLAESLSKPLELVSQPRSEPIIMNVRFLIPRDFSIVLFFASCFKRNGKLKSITVASFRSGVENHLPNVRRGTSLASAIAMRISKANPVL